MNDKFFAGGFLFDRKARSVLLHKRDGKTKVNPHKWAFFGGLNEGVETPVQCFLREIAEELGIHLPSKSVTALRDYLNTELRTYRYVFYAEDHTPKSAMTLAEGADFDWVSLDKVFEYDLTDKTRDDLLFFVRALK